ncbi:hypothetical protein JCM11641_007680 [Rhodosporidiobolus odoratus]
MTARRRLPLELQACILMHLARPAFPGVSKFARFTVPSSSRFSSTATLPSSRLFPPAATTASQPQEASASRPSTSAFLFEDTSDEYTCVPLSTLDNPPTPRTPDELLISLLRSSSPTAYADARSHLQSLRAADQPIPPRYFFAVFAHTAAERDIRDAAWLEWWKLAPAVTDRRYEGTVSVRQEDRRLNKLAGKLVNLLVQGTREGKVELDMLADFGRILTAQGYTRVVADRVLPHLAAYGPPEQADKLFYASLRELRRQQDDFVADSASLGYRTWMNQSSARQRALESHIRKKLDARLRVNRATSLQDWFAERTKDAYAALCASRDRMILVHASLGRLDLAINLALSTQRQPALDPSQTLRLDRNALLKLFDRTASSNRFDLFEPLYNSLRASERKLVRVRNKALKVGTPFFIRGAAYETDEASVPSAREAYTAFRDRRVVSSIEEGPASGEDYAFLSPEELHSAPEHHFAFGQPPSVYELAEVKAALEMQDFERSSAILARFLSLNRFPPTSVASGWIEQAKARQQHSLLAELDHLARTSPTRRGYWTTATMLAHVQAGDYHAALSAYEGHYDVAALPLKLRVAMGVASGRAPRRLKRKLAATQRFPPSSYTFSVLLQALIPQLELRATRSESTEAASQLRGHVTAVYNLLVPPSSSSPSRLDIIPSFKLASATVSLADHAPSSLSPYTFIPFLLYHLRQQSPPLILLRILASMTRLSLQPQLPHYAILLNSFARFGDSPANSQPADSHKSDDLLFLLECFSFRTVNVDTPLAARASRVVVELLSEGKVALPPTAEGGEGGQLSAPVYTGILAGLLKRGEKATALQVLQQVAQDRPEDVKSWGKEDERFRHEVVQVMKGREGS